MPKETKVLAIDLTGIAYAGRAELEREFPGIRILHPNPTPVAVFDQLANLHTGWKPYEQSEEGLGTVAEATIQLLMIEPDRLSKLVILYDEHDFHGSDDHPLLDAFCVSFSDSLPVWSRRRRTAAVGGYWWDK